ncbi:MAG TPA: tetratricopeptide repeat protein, partial [Burkholderiaceae bacterium]|nr:tetratricopeptide repeat protein [Burkholderiaceae bacterium]
QAASATASSKLKFGSAMDYLREGNTCAREGRWREAIIAYRTAALADPACVQAYNNLGHLLYLHGHHERAVNCFMRAITLAPQLATVRENLLDALVACIRAACKRQNFVEARRWITLGFSSIGACPALIALRGGILLEERRFQAAMANFAAVLRDEPTNAVVWGQLGQACLGVHDHKRAKAAFMTAMHHAPEHIDYPMQLGDMAMDEHEYSAALHWYERAARIDAAHPTLARRLERARRGVLVTQPVTHDTTQTMPTADDGENIDLQTHSVVAH